MYDETLVPLAEAHRELRPTYPGPGLVEHDAEALLESIVEASAAALRAAAVDRVDAVGLSNQGETTVAWDAKTGKPLAPAIVWQDRRTEAILYELRASGGAETIEARSRLPLDPYFSAPKMAWLLRQQPVQQAARQGRLRLGTTDAFFRARLAGHAATDPATASRTQLLDLERLDWDEELCAAFGVPLESLPPIEPTAAALGELEGRPFTAAIVDQQAALAGQACFTPGQAKCTYGTGCFLLSNAGETAPTGGGGLLPTVAWTLAGRTSYALDGGVLAAGSALTWLVSVGLLRSAQDADAVAGSVADAGGVHFLPALQGLGAPWWRSNARGTFAGISGATQPGHLVRSVLEALAFRVRDIVEAGERLGIGRLRALRVDGGLTASAALMQAQADILGIPIERAINPELTALGVAALAGIGAGVLAGPEAVAACLPEPETIEPRWPDDRREEAYARWRVFLEQAAEL